MIIVQVVGGIGNQLFQYTFGKYLSKRYKQDVVYDIRYFENKKSTRKCELKVIDPNLKIFQNKFLICDKYINLSFRIWKIIFTLNPSNVFINENNFNYDNFVLYDSKSCYYFQGYWQDVKYINYLRQFTFFDKLKYHVESELISYKKSIENEKNSVCIHVRRGDYFSPQNINIYGVCDSIYYTKAINRMLAIVGSPRYFVFSDDLDWVKSNIKLPIGSIIINNYKVNQVSYIYLMSLCKHMIISNSSFSWWAALLNRNEKKEIICPSKWTLLSDETLALGNWIKI